MHLLNIDMLKFDLFFLFKGALIEKLILLNIGNDRILKGENPTLKEVNTLVYGRKWQIFLLLDAIHDHLISMNLLLPWIYFAKRQFFWFLLLSCVHFYLFELWIVQE